MHNSAEKRQCIRVPKELGQDAIKAMKELKLINKHFLVKREQNFLFIPLSRELSASDLQALKNALSYFKILTSYFKPKLRRPRTLLDALYSKLPLHLLASVPRSIDIIGNITIVEIPPELEDYKETIGKAILETHKQVYTVLNKVGAITGPYRLRKLEVIAGKGITETLHREHGCTFYLDVAKVYFSPRLSFEHARVADQVERDEIVLDMFAGIGPFSILISKRSGAKVYAFDINPDAIRYLRKNVAVNKVQDKVIVMQGDARALVKNCLLGKFDRVIMDLPERAIEYVDVACKAIKPEGGILHFYTFAEEPDPIKKAENALKKAVEKAGKKLEIVNVRLMKGIAPRKWQVAIDARIY